MKTRTFFILTLICCVAGVIFFLIQRNWVIIHFTFSPHHNGSSNTEEKCTAVQKKIKFFYFKNNKWHTEQINLVWDDQNNTMNMQQLVKQWLTLLQDEHLLPAHVNLVSVALSSQGGDAYISFDTSLFSPDQSIMKKWLILESLFKTMHDAAVPIYSVMFLVHNKPMVDDHLEFSQPLPVQERL